MKKDSSIALMKVSFLFLWMYVDRLRLNNTYFFVRCELMKDAITIGRDLYCLRIIKILLVASLRIFCLDKLYKEYFLLKSFGFIELKFLIGNKLIKQI